MECPVCGDKLRGIEKYGVEIEICPGCKGIWLDRGELETIVETATRAAAASPIHPVGPKESGRDHDDYGERPAQPKKTTKTGLLGNLMDVIGGGGD